MMKKYIKDGLIKTYDLIVISDKVEIKGKTYYLCRSAFDELEILELGWQLYADLEEIKKEKLQTLIEYDKSLNVNSFYINNEQAWIDRDTRVSLMNSTTILKNANQDTTTLWLNNMPFVISCELLIQMLGNLEIYALQCYNVTELHKANINNLTTIEEVYNYNFKLNYPEKLIFNL